MNLPIQNADYCYKKIDNFKILLNLLKFRLNIVQEK